VDVYLLSLGDHLAGTSPARRLRTIVAASALAEEVGFTGAAIGEHHFGRYIVSAPELLLAAIAERTSRLRLSTAVTLLASADPVRVAEQLGTLDALSGGRAEIVVARGVSARTWTAFGSRGEDEVRQRFDESLRLLLRLLVEDEVTWSGRYRAPLDAVRVEPRPVQRPHPPVWVGGGLSPISADLAAELGLPLMLPSRFRSPASYLPVVERYRAAMVARGHGGRIRVGAPSQVFVGRSDGEALDLWRPHLLAYATFANELRGDGGPVDVDEILRDRAICGGPDTVVERLRRTQDLLGLDVHLVMLDAGGLPDRELFAAIERFGRDVLPRIRARAPLR
jgi:alkanesulfonate monooxygenase SsuD/methylene tetrahydromethanopterin reductase-like flavin-dependent oxidoreductase (luciferase family)